MDGYCCLVAFVISALMLALPSLLQIISWQQFFWRVIIAAFGIVLPVTVFLGSIMLTPDSKDNAAFGWIDCLHYGKIALIPLVAWAVAAFYALEIWQTQHRTQFWLVSGLFMGSLVSLACFLFGMVTIRTNAELSFMLLVPFYTAVWHTYRAIGLIKEAALPPLIYPLTLLGSLPFWISSIILAKNEYLALPDTPPDCFVVSAALNGHERIVRSFLIEDSCRRPRRVNRQLLVFWRLEVLWTAASPQTHRWFRSIYGIVGPLLAARIRTAWAADFVYLLLKPAELAARGLLWLAGRRDAAESRCISQAAGKKTGETRRNPISTQERPQ